MRNFRVPTQTSIKLRCLAVALGFFGVGTTATSPLPFGVGSIPEICAAELKGFARSGDFALLSDGKVCPKVAPGETSVCRAATPKERSQQLVSGKSLSLTGADFVVRQEKGALVVLDRREKVIASQSNPGFGPKVARLWLSPLQDLLVVDYTVSRGRLDVPEAWVLGVQLRTDVSKIRGSSSSGGADTPSESVKPAAKVPAALTKKWRRDVATARRFIKRKRWQKAQARLLPSASHKIGSAEARYLMAVTALHSPKGASGTSVEWLLRLADAPNAEEWLVEARLSDDFKSLRANSEFRKAVGIEASPHRRLTAYERVLGFGGQWEQSAIPCESPRMVLKLLRKPKQLFSLAAHIDCAGQKESTTTRGSWKTKGSQTLLLRFPNSSADDEELSCEIKKCKGDTEDCVYCAPDTDLAMTLRLVRR